MNFSHLSHLFHFGKDFWFYALCILSVCFVVFIAYNDRVKKLVPPVVTFIAFGIFLGPTALGRLLPQWNEMLVQNQMSNLIYGLTLIGLVFIGMRTGFELDAKSFTSQGKTFFSMLIFNNLGPLVFGFMVTYYCLVPIFSSFIGDTGTPFSFSASMGISLAVTALPVLVLLLKSMRMSKTYAGKTALALAGGGDGVLWSCVGVLLIFSSNSGGYEVIGLRILLFIAYLFVMFRFVQRYMAKEYGNVKSIKDLNPTEEGVRAKKIAWLLFILFSSTIFTEAIGMHGLLGAFIFGVITPPGLRHALEKMVKGILESVLLPFFFISTGLKVSFDVTSSEIWIFAGVLSFVGILTKLFCTAVPAHLTGVPQKEAYTIGSLMVAAGLMEVAFATIVLDAKIISPAAFSALIIMAIIRTILTEPLVRIVKWGIPVKKADEAFYKKIEMAEESHLTSLTIATAEAK
jgi:Kef-type K+ transport system membrane component KefB